MTKYIFEQLLKNVKIAVLPKGLRESYSRYEPSDSMSVLNRTYLRTMCRKYCLDGDKEERLINALNIIEANDDIRELYKFLVWDMCNARNRSDNDFYENFDLSFDTQYPDCSKFLLLLACVIPSEQDLIKRRIPKELYEDIPERMISSQLKKYQRTGSCEVEDFPWDKNFYTRAIYLFDRFYFIPYQFGDPFRLFRNIRTGEVVGIYDGEYGFDSEGQLITDEATAKPFITKTEETVEAVTGTYMNPCGFLSQKTISILKSEWKEALRLGDGMLAFHIPSGEGYNPYHVQKSMQMAVDFYAKYFPKLEVKGFWSESWLYDNRLSIVLPEKSNIVEVQRRFYNYSIGADDSMLKLEVWRNEHIDIRSARADTTLEKNVIRALTAGNRFCTTSMIVLKEDVPKIENSYTYVKTSDLQEFGRVVHSLWKEK